MLPATPDFTLPGADGAPVRLQDFQGRKVVLFFYPKADTTACTAEALDFTRLAGDFAEAGTTLVGISRDPVRALARFRDKHALGVRLATDEDGAVLEAYGVWVEKSMYGKTYMGIERSHFVIDENGKVVDAQVKVKPEDSVERAIATLG